MVAPIAEADARVAQSRDMQELAELSWSFECQSGRKYGLVRTLPSTIAERQL